MATKSNLKSVRLSDDLIELIEQQVGDTFTAKLENLVTRCVWELPKKEEELRQIQKRIQNERQKMAEASSRYAKMLNHLRDLEPKFEALEYAIGRAITDWPEEM